MVRNPSRFRSPARPVERVSFDDVQAFLAKVNTLVPGLGLVLPSEAQWEYACRAGTSTATYAGAMRILGEHNGPVLDAIAWYGSNSGVGFGAGERVGFHQLAGEAVRSHAGRHAAGGDEAANAWGLHDMLGNV